MTGDESPAARNYPAGDEMPEGTTFGSTMRIGTVAQEAMSQIEQVYGGRAEVGVVGIVVELLMPAMVRDPDPELDGTRVQFSTIHTRCNDYRPWVQQAIFESGLRVVSL